MELVQWGWGWVWVWWWFWWVGCWCEVHYDQKENAKAKAKKSRGRGARTEEGKGDEERRKDEHQIYNQRRHDRSRPSHLLGLKFSRVRSVIGTRMGWRHLGGTRVAIFSFRYSFQFGALPPEQRHRHRFASRTARAGTVTVVFYSWSS